MTDDEPDDAYSSDKIKQYEQEVIDRWGEVALRESQDRINAWTEEDRERIEAEGKDILERIVALMDKSPEDNEVQDQIARYYKYINNFYEYDPEIFRSMGVMYEKDERFAAYFKKYHEDLPGFMRKSIAHYVDNLS